MSLSNILWLCQNLDSRSSSARIVECLNFPWEEIAFRYYQKYIYGQQWKVICLFFPTLSARLDFVNIHSIHNIHGWNKVCYWHKRIRCFFLLYSLSQILRVSQMKKIKTHSIFFSLYLMQCCKHQSCFCSAASSPFWLSYFTQ